MCESKGGFSQKYHRRGIGRMPSGDWVSLKRDPNYKSYQPQERFGT
jgi:hypothetical protein